MRKTLLFIGLTLVMVHHTIGQTLSETQMRNARATGYAIMAARNPGKSFSIIMIPWDGTNTLEYNANTQINSGWHPQAAVKGNYFDQSFNGSDFSNYSSVVLSEQEFNQYKSTGTQWWIVCSPIPSFSNTISTNNANQSGYIGIGTSTPSAKLHLLQSSNTDWAAYIQNTGGTGKGVRIQAAGADATPVLQMDDNLGVNRFVVQSNGKTGIGTMTPGAQLTVALPGYSGTPVNSSLVYINQSTNPVGSDLKPALELSNGGGSGYGLVSIATNNYFSGNVGIGTNTPLAKFHLVNGNQGFKFLTGTNTSGYDLSIGVNDDGINFSNSSAIRGFNFSNSSGGLLTIASSGNVGIGSTNPDAKLAVKGQIHANEVKVDLNVPGPDYVFEKDYKLTSLEEIKTYIDQNKHLPEMPSAKEMEKNGVQLGEMNMLLLKKIEELTLYMIDQNKRDQDQKKQIETLLMEVEKLKNTKTK